MTADAVADQKVPDLMTKDDIRKILSWSGDVKDADAPNLWRAITETARRAGLRYAVHCKSCGRVVFTTQKCSQLGVRYHDITHIHSGSIVHGYDGFMRTQYAGLGPKLRVLMTRLVGELQKKGIGT